MKKLVIKGGKKLSGTVAVSGSKNAILKAIVAACLTDEEVVIHNVPLITDVYVMLDIIGWIGGKVELHDHTLKIKIGKIQRDELPLEIGAKVRVSSMLLAPLLIRNGKATIPNPGGCRIGARPIDRHIKGLEAMGGKIKYNSQDGFFHARANKLHGVHYKFEKNTHTGTETLLLASVLAKGQTVLENCALEPEVDDLIKLLNKMGARIKRVEARTIVVTGVKKLHGCEHTIISDRNEVVTLAIASALTGGEIIIKKADLSHLSSFLEEFKKANGRWEQSGDSVRFYMKGRIHPTQVVTNPYPSFMTDWQAPWAVLMTQADGVSTIHETVYEDRFGYVHELIKMGAKMKLYNPHIRHPELVYNFNYEKKSSSAYSHAVKIYGQTRLHNAVVNISDLRAGATLVLASLIAKGETVIYGVESLERGYEKFDERLKSLGTDIRTINE